MKPELVIVTGASTGIGRATAERLARAGYRVAAAVRKGKDYDAWKSQGGLPVYLDVTEESSVASAVAELKPELEAASAVHLVNNAGIAVAGPVEGVPIKRWREQFDVNVFGLVRASQAFLPWIRKTKGRLVNVSSISGRATSPFLGPYSASKFAVEAISDALRRELARFGVRTIVIEPGPIATPIWDKNFAKIGQELDELGPAMKELYGPEMLRFAELAKKSASDAVPADKVAAVILSALQAKNPRTRYVVGKAGLPAQVLMADLLPDRWLDSMIAKGFLRKD